MQKQDLIYATFEPLRQSMVLYAIFFPSILRRHTPLEAGGGKCIKPWRDNLCMQRQEPLFATAGKALWHASTILAKAALNTARYTWKCRPLL